MSTEPPPKRTRARTPNNTTTTGFRISDDLWAVLEPPLLSRSMNAHRFGGGRPRVSDRRCADAIFYVLRTGCQWAALNATDLCPKSTAYDRFRDRVAAGVFLKRWQVGVERFDELKGSDWDWLRMDGAMTTAPLGGKKTGPNPTDRGKAGVKRSVLTEGHGVPIGVAIDGANRHDMNLVCATIERWSWSDRRRRRSDRRAWDWIKAMMMTTCAQPCANLASRRTFAVAARKRRRSPVKRASGQGAGSSNAVIVGSTGFAAC